MVKKTRGWAIKDKLEFWSMPEPMSGCTLWIGSVNGGGYGHIYYGGKNRLAHRISWELNNGPVPGGLWVLHKCDNRVCINHQHLYVGTRNDNSNDAVLRDRYYLKKGSRHPFAKLTDRDIENIKSTWFNTYTSASNIARKYSISKHSVYAVINGTRQRSTE